MNLPQLSLVQLQPNKLVKTNLYLMRMCPSVCKLQTVTIYKNTTVYWQNLKQNKAQRVTVSSRINMHVSLRELISVQKTSHNHHNKALCRLR